MDSVTHREVWMLLGEKDVQIYQLLKEIERLTKKDKGQEEKPAPKGL